MLVTGLIPYAGEYVRNEVDQDGGMLVVFAGRPGTGKTTLSRRLAADLGAALVRIDAIKAAIVRSGELRPPLGPVGYVVAQEVVAGCLAVGTVVVVDAVSRSLRPAPAGARWRRRSTHVS